MPNVRLGDLNGQDEPDDSTSPDEDSSVDDGELVWHYRDRKTTESILTQHAFWGMDVEGFCDKGELKNGNQVVARAWAKLVDEWDPRDEPGYDWDEIGEWVERASSDLFVGSAFACCFSRNGDIKKQWEEYGGKDGFSIGIPKGVRLPVVGQAREESFTFYDELHLRWLSMHYGEEQQLTAAERGLWGFIQEWAVGQPGWSDEDFDGTQFSRDRLSSIYTSAAATIKNEIGRLSVKFCSTGTLRVEAATGSRRGDRLQAGAVSLSVSSEMLATCRSRLPSGHLLTRSMRSCSPSTRLRLHRCREL